MNSCTDTDTHAHVHTDTDTHTIREHNNTEQLVEVLNSFTIMVEEHRIQKTIHYFSSMTDTNSKNGINRKWSEDITTHTD